MKPTFGARGALAWVALACGLALSVFGWRYLQQQALEDAQASFAEQCRDVHRIIESRLDAYVGLLHGLRALHAARGGLSGDKVRDYLAVLELARRFPALDTVHFRVPAAVGQGAVSLLPSGESAPALPQTPWPASVAVGEVELAVTALGQGGATGSTLALGLGLPPLAHRPSGEAGLVLSLPRLVDDAVPAAVLRQLRLRLVLLPAAAGGKVQDAASGRVPDPARSELLDTALGATPPDLAGGIAAAPAELLRTAARVRLGDQELALEFSAAPTRFMAPLVPVLTTCVLLAGVAASLLLFVMLQRLAGSQRKLEEAVAERTRELQGVNRELREEMAERNQLERAVFHYNVDERRRFAAELRDGIGHRLEAVLTALHRLQSGLLKAGHRDAAQAGAIAVHVQTALDQGRMLGLGLHPPALQPHEFIAALRSLAAEAAGAFGVACRFEHDGGPVPAGDMLLHNLYRIVQQAITNAVTHGKARQVRIELRTAAGLHLAVTDDGIGWPPEVLEGAGAANHGLGAMLDGTHAMQHARTATQPGAAGADGIGLAIMRYRCAVLGLSFRLAVAPDGQGAAIVVDAPADG